MAVLADAVTGRTAREVMRRVMEGERMIAATLYFRYYVNMAMARAGLGDMYLDCLGPWREQMAEGLTTWAETPDPTRSDCHAWSASPNIEPLPYCAGYFERFACFRQRAYSPVAVRSCKR
ncbi:MAG: hypothetical protein L6V35_00780 [Alistipes putredinis]|nr:MAG: hypothetical protein L6V35_00780 [Alistipes putredinis]